ADSRRVPGKDGGEVHGRVWRKAWDRVAVRRYQLAAGFRELGQGAPLDLQEVHDLLKSAPDLAIHLLGREIDEGGGEPSEQAFEAQPLVQQIDQAGTLLVLRAERASLPIQSGGRLTA